VEREREREREKEKRGTGRERKLRGRRSIPEYSCGVGNTQSIETSYLLSLYMAPWEG
jgi:hypothetical protein